MTGHAPSASSAQRPKDAATLVIIDDSGDELRVLMGRRRPEQIFLPNKYVFPGGGIDKADRTMVSVDELRAPELAKLLIDMKGHANEGRARGLALAAVRETFEEAGLLVGQMGETTSAINHPTWRSFADHGVLPALGELTFFARAITPPGRTRRYDTRFFFVRSGSIAKRVEACDDELRDLDWFTFDEVRMLDLPNITRAIVEDLIDRLLTADPALAVALGQPPGLKETGLQDTADARNQGQWAPDDAPVPFYYFKGGSFERILLSSNAP